MATINMPRTALDAKRSMVTSRFRNAPSTGARPQAPNWSLRPTSPENNVSIDLFTPLKAMARHRRRKSAHTNCTGSPHMQDASKTLGVDRGHRTHQHRQPDADVRQLEQERRSLAILAADAVDYCRSMGANEWATIHSLFAARDIFRDRVAERHGTVVDMAGDSVLCAFETVSDGLRAAVAIQDDLAGLLTITGEYEPLRFRIGLHAGHVTRQPDGTIYGEAVNVASRLQALAVPGGIVVSAATRAEIGSESRLCLADLGERALKNIFGSFRVYEVVPTTTTHGQRA